MTEEQTKSVCAGSAVLSLIFAGVGIFALYRSQKHAALNFELRRRLARMDEERRGAERELLQLYAARPSSPRDTVYDDDVGYGSVRDSQNMGWYNDGISYRSTDASPTWVSPTYEPNRRRRRRRR